MLWKQKKECIDTPPFLYVLSDLFGFPRQHRLKFFCKHTVYGGIHDSLIAPVRTSQCPLKTQTAFFHDRSGIWIVRVMLGFHPVCLYLRNRNGSTVFRASLVYPLCHHFFPMQYPICTVLVRSFISTTEMDPIGSCNSFGTIAHW